jgi:shikimate dehydrogenase
VTVPHKQAALALVDALAPDAREIGAVNTIVREGSRLTGYNTDVVGFLRALRDDAGLDPQGEVVVVLGAGGAARACVAALLDAGAAEVRVANRSLANAEAVAARAGDRVRATDISESALLGAAILVNSTTVGMAGGPLPDESPVPAAWLGGFRLVYDLVYRPAVTPLIRDAGARGISTLGGLPMLIYQGAASFELWTGRDAPVDAMRSAARAALGEATPC